MGKKVKEHRNSGLGTSGAARRATRPCAPWSCGPCRVCVCTGVDLCIAGLPKMITVSVIGRGDDIPAVPDIILVACENIDRCAVCEQILPRREQTYKLTVRIGIVYQFCVLTVRVQVALAAVLRGRAVRSHACAKIGQVVSAGRLAGAGSSDLRGDGVTEGNGRARRHTGRGDVHRVEPLLERLSHGSLDGVGSGGRVERVPVQEEWRS